MIVDTTGVPIIVGLAISGSGTILYPPSIVAVALVVLSVHTAIDIPVIGLVGIWIATMLNWCCSLAVAFIDTTRSKVTLPDMSNGVANVIRYPPVRGVTVAGKA
jgi:hypothetical protein